MSLYIDHAWAGALGLMVLILGTLLLFFDLGRPERFWRAFCRPHRSWISRGCYFITLLVLLGALDLASRITGPGFLPWQSGSPPAMFLRGAAAGLAVLVMIYTGFVLSPSPAIPFWNSALLPIVFADYSLLAGIDLLILASPFLPGPSLDLVFLENTQSYLALLCLVLVLSHLSVMSRSALAAREAFRLLTRGQWAGAFLGGVVGLGLLAPLLLGWPLARTSEWQVLFAVSGLLALFRLFGDYLFRFLILRVGLYDPLL